MTWRIEIRDETIATLSPEIVRKMEQEIETYATSWRHEWDREAIVAEGDGAVPYVLGSLDDYSNA